MLKDTTAGGIKSHASLVLHVDGGCEQKNPGGVATAGWVCFDQKKVLLASEGQVVQDGGPLATNNYGEYSALRLALTWLDNQQWRGDLIIKADSRLLVEQVRGSWKCKAEHLRQIRDEIHELLRKLQLHIVTENTALPKNGRGLCHLIWVPREKNHVADALCHEAYALYKGVSNNDTKIRNVVSGNGS